MPASAVVRYCPFLDRESARAKAVIAKIERGLNEATLDAAVTVPTNTPETMQLAGFLALRRSCVAAADRRRGDVDAPLEYAAELAARTGEDNAYGLGFGPINVDLYRISGLLEVGDHERVVSIAASMNRKRMSTVRVGSPTGPTMARRWPGCGDATKTR